jgi:hypothetical protein
MRFPRFAFLALFALIAHFASAQQTGTTSTQGAAVLQKSLAALAPSSPITDVTLSGSARRIAGSDDESGTVVVKALAGTGARIDLSLPSGTRSELRNTSAAEPAGSWSGPDAVSHSISNHNLFTDPGWFPAFTLSSLLWAPNAVITYAGPETRDGQSVIHITASQQFTQLPADIAPLMQHLTQTDIFLDPNTNLPVAIAFSTHPDNNALLDIPIELRFSDYRPAGGAQVPFHVQKFINNSLALGLQFTSATLNFGLTPADFVVPGLQTGASPPPVPSAAGSQSASGVTP